MADSQSHEPRRLLTPIGTFDDREEPVTARPRQHSNWGRRILQAMLALVVLGGVQVATSSPASAASKAATCSGPFQLKGRIYYVSSGSYWRVHRFGFRISGDRTRTKNNVGIFLYERDSQGHSTHSYSYNSKDNVVSDGRAYNHRPRPAQYVLKSRNTFVEFHATFDLPAAPDQRCWFRIDF